MDWDDVEKLVALMDDHGLEEIEYENEHVHIRMKKPSVAGFVPAAAHQVVMPTAVAGATAPAAVEATAEVSLGRKVTCPFVGTFYGAPSPDAEAFVTVGQTVRKGETLCIIEAMKLMNEIEAEFAGKVLEILVDNAQPVEFRQALFVIEPL